MKLTPHGHDSLQISIGGICGAAIVLGIILAISKGCDRSHETNMACINAGGIMLPNGTCTWSKERRP